MIIKYIRLLILLESCRCRQWEPHWLVRGWERNTWLKLNDSHDSVYCCRFKAVTRESQHVGSSYKEPFFLDKKCGCNVWNLIEVGCSDFCKCCFLLYIESHTQSYSKSTKWFSYEQRYHYPKENCGNFARGSHTFGEISLFLVISSKMKHNLPKMSLP